MGKLTEHFTLEEATRSAKAAELGIENLPETLGCMASIVYTALEMEKVRALLGKPITVTSWYRGPKLNAAVGGRPTSQHCKGEAVDFVCPGFGTVQEVFDALKDSAIDYDQLIVEKTKKSEWIHVSFSNNPRRMALSYDGKTYTKVA